MFFIMAYSATITLLVVSAVSIYRSVLRVFPNYALRVRRGVGLLTLLFLSCNIIVYISAVKDEPEALRLFVVISVLLFTMSCGLGAAAPLAAWLMSRAKKSEGPTNAGRRSFLRAAGTAVPIGAAVTGPIGVASAHRAPVVRKVSFDIPGLDPRLGGMRIAQFTDVHLGTFINVEQVKAATELLRPFSPDVVVFTGDIADNFKMLGPALEAAATLAPKSGFFASIGNHEIYRGREEAENIYRSSPARYLCNEGVVSSFHGAPFYICGLDDPATLGKKHDEFLEESAAQSLKGCPPEVSTKIVLSHRPEGFVPAAEHHATLTLSGHTHGSQIALFGRSIFEWIAPNSFLLGKYKRNGNSFLYTSAGLGHWFPFRLGCPCEVALITLSAAEK